MFKTLNMKREEEFESPIDLKVQKVKFEIYGEEMVEKNVKPSGNSGRIYLPPQWIGQKVKIVRIK
jgi:putative transposon-encoded protein